MKSILLIVILAIVAVGGWYGASVWRFNSVLDSGRVVLLINKDSRVYTYSDLMPRDEITRDFKIVGYADVLSEQEVKDRTAGMNLVVGVEPVAGDPRVISRIQAETVVLGASEQAVWAAAVAKLTAQQQALCGSLDTTSAQQYCLARHIVFAAFTAKAGAAACAPLFVPEQKTECEADLASSDASLFVDADRDQLLDDFEYLAIPYDKRVNDRGLPEISL